MKRYLSTLASSWEEGGAFDNSAIERQTRHVSYDVMNEGIGARRRRERDRCATILPLWEDKLTLIYNQKRKGEFKRGR